MSCEFLFPKSLNEQKGSFWLLGMRIVFGALLLVHGFQKLSNFDTLAAGNFPDLFGLGSGVSVSLAIFGEFFCSIAFILGFLYRLSMLPMIITLLVAFVFVHQGALAEGELALVYLLVFIFLYIAGAGKYSIDHVIAGKLQKKA